MPLFTPISAEELPQSSFSSRRDYVSEYIELIEGLPEGHYLQAILDEDEVKDWVRVRDSLKHRFRRVATVLGRTVKFHRSNTNKIIMSFSPSTAIDVMAELAQAEAAVEPKKPSKPRRSAVKEFKKSIQNAATAAAPKKRQRKVARG